MTIQLIGNITYALYSEQYLTMSIFWRIRLNNHIRNTGGRFHSFSQMSYIVRNGLMGFTPNNLHGALTERVTFCEWQLPVYGLAKGCCKGFTAAYLLAPDVSSHLSFYFDLPWTKSIIRGVMNAQHLCSEQSRAGNNVLCLSKDEMMASILSAEGPSYRHASYIYRSTVPKDIFQLRDIYCRGRGSYEIILGNNNDSHSVAMKITSAECRFFDSNVGEIVYPKTQEGYISMERALKIIFEQKYTYFTHIKIINYVQTTAPDWWHGV
jgi:hypothetical protein